MAFVPLGADDERRRFGRIELDEPLKGSIDGVPVDVVEVSIAGFRVTHQARFAPGQGSELRVSWRGKEMRFSCGVARSTLSRLAKTPAEKSIYQSGIRVDEAFGDSEAVLRDLIAERVMRALSEQKENARGVPPTIEYTYQVGKGDRFRRCELSEGKWKSFDTTRSEQPAEGFTVSVEIDAAQVDILKRTYESVGSEGRRLTKMLAELSIKKTEGGPTRRYIP